MNCARVQQKAELTASEVIVTQEFPANGPAPAIHPVEERVVWLFQKQGDDKLAIIILTTVINQT